MPLDFERLIREAVEGPECGTATHRIPCPCRDRLQGLRLQRQMLQKVENEDRTHVVIPRFVAAPNGRSMFLGISGLALERGNLPVLR